MVIKDDVLYSMNEALDKGVSVQKTVRGFIAEATPLMPPIGIAEDICRLVETFKMGSETVARSYLAGGGKEQAVTHRKKTNNIINDVSRICRDMLGYCIVNHVRSKGEYKYKAVEAIPASRAAITRPPATVSIAGSECTAEHFDPAKHMLIPAMDDVAWIMAAWHTSKHKLDIIERPNTAEGWIRKAMCNSPVTGQCLTLEELGRAVVNIAKGLKSETQS